MFNISTEYNKPDINYMLEVITASMNEGIQVSKNIHNIKKQLQEDEKKLAENLMRYGITNPNSPVQVQAYLESVADDNIYEACYDEKTGKWTSKEEAIAPLVHLGYQMPADLLLYRQANGLVKAVNKILEFMDSDYKIRPKTNLQKTNRITYVDPPLMNIPKKILWSLIKGRRQNSVLVSIDIKNQEPNILINMLHIEKLQNLLRQDTEEKGLYRLLYKDIFNEETTKDTIQYNETKTTWNALTYGLTKMGAKKQCRNVDGEKIYKYFNQIKELANYRGKCYAMATKGIQKTTTIFGTEVVANKASKTQLQRSLMDLPIQGTGADILSLLIENFNTQIVEMGIEEYIDIYFSRHDELVLDIDGYWLERVGVERVMCLLRELFEHSIDDWDPFKVDINIIDHSLNL